VLIEVTLRASDARAEVLCDALLQCGALSVAIENAGATVDEQALYGEPGLRAAVWSESWLRVLTDAEHADAIVAAAGAATNTALLIEHRAAIEDIDWVRATQAQFAPIQIGPRLWIVPSWHEPPRRDAVVVRLDPGLAFGTGSHPTTRLCLEWLDENVVPAARVLDYGCGSGILGIAAAKLGAGAVDAIDIDPQALDAARANARTNEVAASYTGPDELAPSATFDIVLANILSNPLKLLAPALLTRVAPGGSLVLSGILERQAGDVIATYRHADPALPLEVWRREEGWVCLAGTRPL
jgi:ribosomal protein L11 methyltransferase